MPVRDRRPGDEQPLIKPANTQVLVRPVGGGQEEQEEPRGAEGAQASPQAGGAGQAEKGPIARALDRAQENKWVYDSVANKVRENGLADKADELLSRLTGK